MHPPGPLALAPMDGVTDHVFRDLLTAHAGGRIAYCVSEFVRVTAWPLPPVVFRREVPEVRRGGTTPAGVPVMVQLLGGDPESLAATARNAIVAGAFGVDLNFGCPAKLVNRHDGGACLLRSPERIERIVAAVRAAVPADRPVSAKVRLGWESREEVVAVARAAERGGASFLTVHGRTKQEMYGPPADWAAIGRARAAVSIPVVANGDLNGNADVAACAATSGCEHFMLGRGAMGRPSMLTGGSAPPPSAEEESRGLAVLLVDYLERLAAAGASDERRVARVKQWLSLGSVANPGIRPAFERVKRLTTVGDVRAALH